MLGRRQILIAAPVLALVAAGCEPLNVAEGKTPAVSDEVRMLQAAVAAEQDLIDLYTKTMASYSGLSSALAPLLAQHRDHLSHLRATVSYPAGKSAPTRSGRVAVASGDSAAAVRALRSAESAAAAGQLARLASVSAGNAQLLASIATCETLHVSTLESVS